MSKSKFPDWLRWLTLLPLSVLGAFLGYLFVKFITAAGISMYDPDPESWVRLYLVEIIANGALGAAFVGIGEEIAPHHKKTVIIVMLVLVALVAGASVFASYLKGDIFSGLCALSMIVGAAYPLIELREQKETYVKFD